jgi:cytochrome bd ubiquinol oxidase subunit II
MAWLEAHTVQIWFLIIGFLVLYYAVADGLDLGVGMIALFTEDEEERGIMMASLQSVWHDNQTWLVVLGGMVFGAFPLFYSIAFSAFYVPVMIMLLGLTFRGVAFEFRSRSRHPSFWSLSFGLGSLIAATGQGFTLGGIFYGIPMEGHTFTGTIWSWFHPYSVLFSLGVISGYIMLGANYLILKTHGKIQVRSRSHSFAGAIVMLIISLMIYVWTIVRHPYIAQKWLSPTELIYVAAFPLLALFAFVMYLWNLRRGAEMGPLLWNALLIFCSFAGISVGFYPFIIPNMVTIHDAAASSPKTLIFMLIVTIIFLPVMLIYIGFKNRIFRGKVGSGSYGD